MTGDLDKLRLTDEQKEAAKRWITEKSGPRQITCQVCGHHDWIIGDHGVAPPVFRGGYIISGPAYPMVMLICTTCAHTIFLNAVMMGLSLGSKPAEVAKKEDAEKQKGAEPTPEPVGG